MDEKEKQLEQEALAKIDPEVIRAEVISELGFDEVDDAERIDKAVAREVKTRTMAFNAIGSKIKTREELETLKKTPPKQDIVPDDVLEKKLDAKLNERLEQRDLEALEYPDELKSEIKRTAQIQGVSIKQVVAKDPYILFKIEAYEKTQEAEEASLKRTNKSGKVTVSADEPPEVDMSTEDGRKKWDEYMEKLKKTTDLKKFS